MQENSERQDEGPDIQAAFNAANLLFSAEISLESHVVKKNSKSIYYRGSKGNRTPFIASNPKQRAAENLLVRILSERARLVHLTQPIRDPVLLLLKCFYPRHQFLTKKGTISKNIPDVSNLIELPQDALVKAGILEDDCQVLNVMAQKAFLDSITEPLLEIKIYKNDYLNLAFSETVATRAPNKKLIPR